MRLKRSMTILIYQMNNWKIMFTRKWNQGFVSVKDHCFINSLKNEVIFRHHHHHLMCSHRQNNLQSQLKLPHPLQKVLILTLVQVFQAPPPKKELKGQRQRLQMAYLLTKWRKEQHQFQRLRCHRCWFNEKLEWPNHQNPPQPYFNQVTLVQLQTSIKYWLRYHRFELWCNHRYNSTKCCHNRQHDWLQI